jgi:hypothetical protein
MVSASYIFTMLYMKHMFIIEDRNHIDSCLALTTAPYRLNRALSLYVNCSIFMAYV